MNVQLAAQTLSASVANAIEFLDISMTQTQFKNSERTVNFIRYIDRATAEYLLSLVEGKNKKQELLPIHNRKTFIVGFVP